MSEAGAINMPTFSSMQRNIRLIVKINRHNSNRQDRHQYLHPLVRDIMLELPNEYRQTVPGAQFLVFDSGVGDPTRIIIFHSQNTINLLRNSEH